MISAGYKSTYQQGYSDAMRDFRKKPKTGHWIDMTSGYAFNDKCSECGYIVNIQYISEYKYCPNCGAKMDKK